MTEIVTFPTDDVLREHLLTDDRLVLAEVTYPGLVRVLAAGRYHARFDVDGRVCTFNIIENARLERELVGNFPDAHELLSALVWHRAAEAMLAVRRGHQEARQSRALRKPKQRQDD